MPLHDPREDEAGGREADIEGAPERQVQRAVISIENVDEGVVGRVDQQWDAKLLDAVIEGLEAGRIDMIVASDRARNVDADKTELLHHAIEFIDGSLRVLQRHHAGRPDAPRIATLSLSHLVIVHARIAHPISQRNFRKECRKRPKRTYNIAVVAGGIHMPEVIFKVEPGFAPVADDADASIGCVKVIAANAVSFRAGIAALSLAQILEHRPRKPMNMAIENSHRRAPSNLCSVRYMTHLFWRLYEQSVNGSIKLAGVCSFCAHQGLDLTLANSHG